MREMNREPEWLVIARGEIGQKEIKGGKHNPRILEYHATTTFKATNDEVAWCSSFVNWCMKQAGYDGTNSAWAKDWLNWGKKLTKPAYGVIAIIDYGVTEAGVVKGGHVGFVVGKTKNGSLVLLGGNQGKTGEGSVDERLFSTKNINGYVLPADYTTESNDLPIINSDLQEGTYETTR